MVLYFSATGNTRFVATELAKCLEDEALDLCSKIKAHDYPSNPVLSLIGHRVKGFYAADTCISCGLCDKKMSVTYYYNA